MPSRRAYDGLRLLPRPATFVTTSKRAPIPVNIVSGPLGVGKTTTARHLLSLRPKGERWAVLVNEYGLVGLDAALMEQPAELGMALPGARRAKAVLRTEEGWLGFNVARDAEAIGPTAYRRESRVELVFEGSEAPDVDALEAGLLACLREP